MRRKKKRKKERKKERKKAMLHLNSLRKRLCHLAPVICVYRLGSLSRKLLKKKKKFYRAQRRQEEKRGVLHFFRVSASLLSLFLQETGEPCPKTPSQDFSPRAPKPADPLPPPKKEQWSLSPPD
ncbi:hypothetical protein TGGT1_411540 [Toxoplasma gondii GT1]|uniref:Uncharacterized protein n=1 Tax=Toxoplasma gondii (strain ATCC 50853 / GT1) TaxID=507601 RepID=S7UG03_TOXGG|nr:hypothetical protein TGGT1_411540 [Toxoplasma gondii GT1]